MNWTSTVSFWKRRYFLHVLTFHFKIGEPDESIDGCLVFFRCILAQVTSDLISPPFSLSSPRISLLSPYLSLSPLQECRLLYLPLPIAYRSRIRCFTTHRSSVCYARSPCLLCCIYFTSAYPVGFLRQSTFWFDDATITAKFFVLISPCAANEVNLTPVGRLTGNQSLTTGTLQSCFSQYQRILNPLQIS